MQLLLDRHDKTPKSVLGTLAVDERGFCATLEPAGQEIPCGTYKVTRRWSRHFQRIMIHVEDVPGREAIEMHWGNQAIDSRGCILTGVAHDHVRDYIFSTQVTYDSLDALVQAAQERGEPNTIQVRESYK